MQRLRIKRDTNNLADIVVVNKIPGDNRWKEVMDKGEFMELFNQGGEFMGFYLVHLIEEDKVILIRVKMS